MTKEDGEDDEGTERSERTTATIRGRCQSGILASIVGFYVFEVLLVATIFRD
jgi:hypothetical protein